MGILLFDKNADFSTNSLGHAGLYTSVTSNLRGLFELRRSLSKSRQNSAPDNDLAASIAAGVTFTPTSMNLSAVGQVTFSDGPANTGANTIAMIVKIKTGGTTGDRVLGSLTPNPTADGAFYFVHYNLRTQIYTTFFDSQADGGAYSGQSQAFFDSGASDEGTFQMFVGTVESEDSIKLYHPASGAIVSAALSAGQFAYYRQSVADRNFGGLLAGASAAQAVSVFANWDRALTSGEVATFYSEMKDQLGRIGLQI